MLVSVVFGIGCSAKVLQCKKWCKQDMQVFCLPCDETDGFGLQGRDLSNSFMGGLPKSILLHYASCEINKKCKLRLVGPI